MNRLKNILFVIVTVFAVLAASPIYAGEYLGKKEVVKLLSGNTVKGYYMVEGQQQGFTGRVRFEMKFFSDGSAEKYTIMAKSTHGQFTEKGKWFVNKKAKLCVVWTQDNKKKCGRLKQAGGGKYELHRKKQTFFFEELVAGN